jgi:shikimate dehydrogenase
MFPHADASPLDLTPFHSCEAVLDVIYNPAETKLTAQARSLGMKAATGLTMLVAQAKYACELFLGEALPDSLITEIVEELQNV